MLAESIKILDTDSAYIINVKKEYNHICSEIVRLEEFFATEELQALPRSSRFILMDQLHYMRSYRSMLKLRLGILDPK